MAKTARLELRVEPEFKARVELECERRGMKVATFVERAIEVRLAPGVVGGDPKGSGTRAVPAERPGPVREALIAEVVGGNAALDAAVPEPKRVGKRPPSGSIPAIAPRRWAS
jgi:hypothetical protein